MALQPIVTEFEGIVQRSIHSGLRVGYFAALYAHVTRAVDRRIQTGKFDDNPRMIRFARIFAGRYLEAVRAWGSGAPLTEAWRIAFANAVQGNLIVLQDIALGVSAHVNLDLPIAAASVGVAGLKADFEQLNDVIGELVEPAEAAIERFSPTLAILDSLGGRSDAEIVNFSISVAREEAWLGAVHLAATPVADRAAAIRSLDRRASLVARRISEPGSPFDEALAVVRITESKDVPAIVDAIDKMV